jgi:hypothetical protein
MMLQSLALYFLIRKVWNSVIGYEVTILTEVFRSSLNPSRLILNQFAKIRSITLSHITSFSPFQIII